MHELEHSILLAQKSDKQSMMGIITFFNPIISKYTRMMKNDEDVKSELTIYLMELILSMKLSNFRINNDYSIINYVKSALYHQYIVLSKKKRRVDDCESCLNSDDMEGWAGVDTSTTDEINDFILHDMLKKVLTTREYSCIKLIVIDSYSATQAARILGITRQTANEAKIRGLNKLKKHLLGI